MKKDCGPGGKHVKTLTGKYAEGGKVTSYAQPASDGSQQWVRGNNPQERYDTAARVSTDTLNRYLATTPGEPGNIKKLDAYSSASDATTRAHEENMKSYGSGAFRTKPKPRPRRAPKGGR